MREIGIDRNEAIKYLDAFLNEQGTCVSPATMEVLDDKIKVVINYREKYPETTLNELANIISYETETNITKSGINHYFRKIKDLVNKSQSK